MDLINSLVEALDNALSYTTFNVSGAPSDASIYRSAYENSLIERTFLYEFPIALERTETDLRPEGKATLHKAVKDLMQDIIDENGKFFYGSPRGLGGGFHIADVEEFSLALVKSSALFGSRETADNLLSWLNGENIRCTNTVLIDGLDVHEKIKLCDGIWLDKVEKGGVYVSKIVPLEVSVRYRANPSEIKENDGAVLCFESFVQPDIRSIRTGAENPPRYTTRFNERRLTALLQAISLIGNTSVSIAKNWIKIEDNCARIVLAPHIYQCPEIHAGERPSSCSTEFTSDMVRTTINIAKQLHRRRKVFDVPVRRLMRSMTSDLENQFLDLRIALEGLYAKGSSSESQYRIAVQGAWHLGQTADDRTNYFNDFSDLYGVASDVAHGRKIRLTVDEQRALMQRAREACRDGIVKCLEEGELTPNDWKNLVVGKKEE